MMIVIVTIMIIIVIIIIMMNMMVMKQKHMKMIIMIMFMMIIHRFRTVELSSVGPETLTVPLQPDISQFVKDIDFQVIFLDAAQ